MHDYDEIVGIDIHARRLTGGPREIALWLIDLDAQASFAYERILSSDEIARARRLHFERDRRRFVAAHVALRDRLSRALHCAPAALQFAQEAFGKPVLVHAPQCAFNMSHSEGIALIAIGFDLPLGIDVEVVRELTDLPALAQRCCTPAEHAAILRHADRQAQSRAFLHLWTRKEACLKALGMGLSIEPQTFEVGTDPIDATVSIPGLAAPLIVQSIDVGAGAVAALARTTQPDRAGADDIGLRPGTGR